jgi:hypothetical protein
MEVARSKRLWEFWLDKHRVVFQKESLEAILHPIKPSLSPLFTAYTEAIPLM